MNLRPSNRSGLVRAAGFFAASALVFLGPGCRRDNRPESTRGEGRPEEDLAALRSETPPPVARSAESEEDAAITRRVSAALAGAADAGAAEVTVETTDGIVTLRGRVAAESAKSEAGQLAREVEGVEEVLNLIEIVPG